MVLKDQVRRIWISALDCWRILGVLSFQEGFCLFFLFLIPIFFWDFQTGIFFFFFFLAYIFILNFPFLPGLEGWGIMGPGFI